MVKYSCGNNNPGYLGTKKPNKTVRWDVSSDDHNGQPYDNHNGGSHEQKVVQGSTKGVPQGFLEVDEIVSNTVSGLNGDMRADVNRTTNKDSNCTSNGSNPNMTNNGTSSAGHTDIDRSVEKGAENGVKNGEKNGGTNGVKNGVTNGIFNGVIHVGVGSKGSPPHTTITVTFEEGKILYT